MRGGFWYSILAFFVIFLVGIYVYFYFFVKLSRIRVRSIKIYDNVYLTRSDILKIISPKRVDKEYEVRISDIERRLMEVARIRDVDVFRDGDVLKVFVRERMPFMLLLYAGEDSNIFCELDKFGVVIACGDDVREWDLPIISGEVSIRGGRIIDKNVLGVIAFLRKHLYDIYDRISEIHIYKGNRGDEYNVYFVGYSFPIYWKGEFSEIGLKKMKAILGFVSYRGIEPNYVDLRLSSTAIIKLLERGL